MREELLRVIELQRSYGAELTEPMRERRFLVEEEIPSALRTHDAVLTERIGIEYKDFLTEGSNGTGSVATVPWVRFGSSLQSPSSTVGFYVVFLFSLPAGAVYISLNQGTGFWKGGRLLSQPIGTVRARTEWARERLGNWTDLDIVELDLGDDARRRRLAAGYEAGDIAAVRFTEADLPSDEVLAAIEAEFADGLGRIYRHNAEEPLPGENPEVEEAEEAAGRSAGKRAPRKGAGFRQSAAEREAIEEHAVAIVRKKYEDAGWKVNYVGKGGAKPYDLKAAKDEREITIEVKGTTSGGEEVILTAGEVRHHAEQFPDNSLCVVSRIRLLREDPPRCEGGQLHEFSPWKIEQDALSEISYRYAVPRQD